MESIEKVAFGTPEFFLLQEEINTLCEQRRLLGTYYEDNKEAHHQLSRTIREMCGRVYFKPDMLSKPVYIRPLAAPPPARKEDPKAKKKKVPMKLPPKLF